MDPIEGVSRAGVPAALGKLVLLALLSYALAVASYWHFLYIFGPRMDLLYGYQRDLLAGHAEWVADQNRVLGPLLIRAVQTALHLRYESAYQHVMFGMFIVQTLCAAVLFWVCALTLGQGVIGLLLLTTLPLAFMNLWWFPWTNLEFILVLLMLLADAVRVGPGPRACLYGGIFVAWMLTKETCFLLPIWIGLRYGLPALRERRWAVLGRLAALCVGMVALSAGVVAGLRHWLWVSGTNPDYPTGTPADTPTVLAGTHLFSLNPINMKHLIRNYRAFFTLHSPWPLWNNSRFLDWSVGMIEMLVALVITAAGAAWALIHRAPLLLALALTALIYILVLFAVVNPLEADKLMPAVAIGAYAYAILARDEGRWSGRRPG